MDIYTALKGERERADSRDIVEERAERRYGLVPDVLKLHHKMSSQFLVDDGHGEGTRLVLQKVPVVRGLQLYL